MDAGQPDARHREWLRSETRCGRDLVEIQAAGLRVEQTDSYVVGSESTGRTYRSPTPAAPARRASLYRAGDCYLQGNDAGFGRVDSGAPACIVDPD